jgi:hypothetical protein
MDEASGPSFPRDHPLAGCEQKIRRAKQHFEFLKEEIAGLGSGEIKLTTFRTELKPNAENTLWTVVESVTEPPLYLATVVGDIVHNLRSSLDHLVFELAFLGLRGKALPTNKVAFPASTTRANWESPYVQGLLLAGVMKKHRAMLYKAQPCYRRKDSPTNPRTIRRRKRSAITDLHKLWNEDKHRMLQPVVVAPYGIKPRISGFVDCSPAGEPRLNLGFLGRPLEVDTEVVSVPIRVTGPNPHMDVEVEIGCEIGFRNGLPTVKALAGIGHWVAKVIESFKPVFETPQARRLWGLPRGSWIESESLPQRRTWIGSWDVTEGHPSPPPAE